MRRLFNFNIHPFVCLFQVSSTGTHTYRTAMPKPPHVHGLQRDLHKKYFIVCVRGGRWAQIKRTNSPLSEFTSLAISDKWPRQMGRIGAWIRAARPLYECIEADIHTRLESIRENLLSGQTQRPAYGRKPSQDMEQQKIQQISTKVQP